jgi:Tfp pilus assembly protein PilO
MSVGSALRTTKGMVVAGVAGAVVVLAAGWFLLVGPQRAKADEVATEVSAVQAQIDARRAELAGTQGKPRLKASDVYRLSKAVPDSTDMAGIMLDLDRLAVKTGVGFTSITPSPQVAGTGVNVQPLVVVVDGRFSSLSRYLRELKTLVNLRQGRLDSRGRLFAVDQVVLAAGEKGFPNVTATLTIDAFVNAPQAPVGTTPTPGTDGTTSSDATVAAGATP